MLADITYQEKSIWGQLIATLVVYGRYFISGSPGSLAGTIVLLVIIQIVAQIAIAVANRPEPKDERDRLIAAKAYRVAYTILVAGVLTILFISEAITPTANIIFAALVLADVGKSVTRLYYYRRGI